MKIKEDAKVYVEKRKESIKQGVLKKEQRGKNIERSLRQKEEFLNKREGRVAGLKKVSCIGGMI